MRELRELAEPFAGVLGALDGLVSVASLLLGKCSALSASCSLYNSFQQSTTSWLLSHTRRMSSQRLTRGSKPKLCRCGGWKSKLSHDGSIAPRKACASSLLNQATIAFIHTFALQLPVGKSFSSELMSSCKAELSPRSWLELLEWWAAVSAWQLVTFTS